MDSIKLPLHPTERLKSWSTFNQLIHTLLIIIKRIRKKKEKYIIDSDLITNYKIALDIKSLYIFAKYYLDYLIRYLVDVYFRDIKADQGKGLTNRSFDSHVKQLRNQTFISAKELFQKYREYILRNECRLFFKIINVRDKLIVHRDLNIGESWTYFERENKFRVHLSKDIPVGPIQEDLRDEIFMILTKFRPTTGFTPRAYNFFMYDKLLDKIEMRDGPLEINDRTAIAQCRIKLGVGIDEKRIIGILYKFSKGLCDLFGIEKDLYIEKSLRDI